jgi:hypothetical protein
MARGWQPVREILERSGEGEEGAFGRFLLLERRTAPGPERTKLDGTGEILLESADRAAGYFTTRSEASASANARTAGVYWHADPEDCAAIMDGSDERRRAELIAEQLRRWKSITNT